MRKLNFIENNDFVGDATVAVVESRCSHIKTLKFDDHFRIYVKATKLSGATIIFEYNIVKTDDKSLIATGFTKLATVDRKNFKPKRIPELMRSKISSFEGF